MKKDITVGIYRTQEVRYEALPKNSKELVKLHKLRMKALHDVFDNQEIVQVKNWGFTDDETSHEYVEIILSAIGTTVIQQLLIAGMKKLGEKLAEKAIDETTSQLVKWVISKLAFKVKEQKISGFNIRLKDGTFIQIDPPQENSKINVQFKDGKVTSIKYQLDKE